MAKYLSQSQPRNTYENPKVLNVVDARLLILVLACILHFRWYTVGLTIIVAAILWYFEVRRALSVGSAVRFVRQWLVGNVRYAKGYERRHGQVDFQRKGVYWRPYQQHDWYPPMGDTKKETR
jgi:hypothetical protein